MEMTAFTIQTTAPYDFPKMAARLLALEKSMYRSDGKCLLRTVRLAGKPRLLKIRVADASRECLSVEICGEVTAAVKDEGERLLRHMFSTDVDLSGFYQHVADDVHLKPIIHRLTGLRMVREPDLFESFAKTIISQQVNMAFAGTLTTRLIERAGDPLAIDGEQWPVFPTPEQVANLTYDDLRALQFSQRKAEYVIDLARLIVNGELQLERLWHLSDEEVMSELTRLRGVGRWTVECLLLFGMGRPNLLPAADIGLRNAVRRAYGLDHQPTEAEVREIGAPWSPWSSYVTFYLWESLE